MREIWYCASEQSGKTQTMLNCLHWAVGVSPGDVFYLMPTEATARNMVESSLVPLLTRSRSLKKIVSDRADDTTLTRIRLENNVVIRPAWANLAEKFCGKDTTTGHWEIAGLLTETPFKTYPDGFPKDFIQQYEEAIGRQVMGNYPASGTEIIEVLREEHKKTRKPAGQEILR